MEFLLELLFEIFGAAVEETMESSKIPLRLKIAVFSLICGLCFAFFVGVSIFSALFEKDFINCIIFTVLALVFLAFWIFGVIRLKRRHRK